MSRIVEIKKLYHQELGRKVLIMFLDCGHGFVYTSNLQVGETVSCSKCDAAHVGVLAGGKVA